MNKLRLDYLRILGSDLSIGDNYSYETDINAYTVTGNTSIGNPKGVIVESFAPRENTGEQPCGDGVPLIVEWIACGNVAHAKRNSTGIDWSRVTSWKPDREALIKMQNEHDSQQAITDHAEISRLMNGDIETSGMVTLSFEARKKAPTKIEIEGRSDADIKSDLTKCGFAIQNKGNFTVESSGPLVVKETEQPIYTPEMQSIKATPEPGMLVRVEFNCNNQGFQLLELTYREETDKEILFTDDVGLYSPVDKVEFVAYHAIDTRDEMEEAKEKQLIEVSERITALGYCMGPYAIAQMLQQEGRLAEIVLPLEK